MPNIDIVIILLFVAYMIYSGLSSRRKASVDLEQYFLAGRTLKGWQAGLSMAATQFASDTPLLVAGLVATAGIFSLWQMWIYALSFLLVGFLLAPSWRRALVLTDAELAELRYAKKWGLPLRIFKAIYFGTVFNCTVLAWVFFAATKIAEPFLKWDQWLPQTVFDPALSLVTWVGVPLTLSGDLAGAEVWVISTSNFISVLSIVLLTFFYSTTGGLRAVVKTDIAQIAIMLTATFFYAYFIIEKVGGLGALQEGIYQTFHQDAAISASQILSFTPGHAKDVTTAMLFVFALQWLIQLNSDGTGYLAQRSMACRTEKDAKIAAVVFSFTQVFLRSLLWLPIAVGLLLIYPPEFATDGSILAAHREGTFVLGIRDILPAGFSGIMLVGMLAALASTVDTHLNWGASYWTHDIYDRYICQHVLRKKPSKRSLVWVARFANLLILCIALVIGTQLTSIQEAWQISLLLGAGVGIVLVLRWLWWRINAWSEIAALLGSAVASPVAFFYMDSQMERLLTVAIVSTALALLATYFFGPEPKEVLEEFYTKAKPPGFWGPFATNTEPDPKRYFYRMLAAGLTCAFSIFSLLVGIGTLLVGSPSPIWFPFAAAWPYFVIGIGALLIPLWVWLGFKTSERKG